MEEIERYMVLHGEAATEDFLTSPTKPRGINCQAAECQCEVLDGERGKRMKGKMKELRFLQPENYKTREVM